MAVNLSVVPKRAERQEITAFLRKDLRRVVNIHGAMFQKLLFQNEELPLELADLFEDAGNRYLDISEQITQLHRSRQKTKD